MTQSEQDDRYGAQQRIITRLSDALRNLVRVSQQPATPAKFDAIDVAINLLHEVRQ